MHPQLVSWSTDRIAVLWLTSDCSDCSDIYSFTLCQHEWHEGDGQACQPHRLRKGWGSHEPGKNCVQNRSDLEQLPLKSWMVLRFFLLYLSLFVHSLHLGQAGFDNEIYSTWHYQPPSNPEEAQTSEHLQVEMVRKSLPVDIHSRNLCGSL